MSDAAATTPPTETTAGTPMLKWKQGTKEGVCAVTNAAGLREALKAAGAIITEDLDITVKKGPFGRMRLLALLNKADSAVSIRAGRILTYLTRVHSYLPNPRVRSTRSANTSESPLTNPPSGALAQLVRQAAPCRHLLKSSHETAHGTTGTAPVQERNAAITDGWAESSGRARW